jgi:hypothetical protein
MLTADSRRQRAGRTRASSVLEDFPLHDANATTLYNLLYDAACCRRPTRAPQSLASLAATTLWTYGSASRFSNRKVRSVPPPASAAPVRSCIQCVRCTYARKPEHVVISPCTVLPRSAMACGINPTVSGPWPSVSAGLRVFRIAAVSVVCGHGNVRAKSCTASQINDSTTLR